MDRQGNALLSWHVEPSGVLEAVRFSAATGVWSSLQQISSPGFVPKIAADSDGNFVVIWQTTLSSSIPPQIQARRYASNSGTWGPIVTLSDVGASGAQVVMDANGNATAVWQRFTGTAAAARSAIQGARFVAAAGTWSGAINVTAPPVSLVGGPRLDVDLAGHVRIAWLKVANVYISPEDRMVQSTRWFAGVTSPLPGPPTLTSAVNGFTVTLSWTASPVGSVATSYILEAGTSPGTSNVFNGNVGPGTTLTAAVGAGTYYVRLRAKNDAGISTPSNELTLVVGGAVGAPGQPTITSAVANGGILNVSWQPGAGPAATSHRLDFYSAGSLVASVSAGATTSIAIPVPAGTQGTFDVRVTPANGAVSGSPSSPMTFTIGAGCSPPASPSVSGAVINGTATVNWAAVPGATSYVLSAGTTPGGTQYMAPTNLGSTTGASASGLPAGFTAWVRVFAVNACGQQSTPVDFLVQ